MTINDGGPAFPIYNTNEIGMSLRDWFAGQALIGMLSSGNYGVVKNQTVRRAYEFADAMIAERED